MAVTKLYLRPKIIFTGNNIQEETILNEIALCAHQIFYCKLRLTQIIIDPKF